ncbi:MAG: AAA family ATPase [Magnetococcus sp. MYC-9]
MDLTTDRSVLGSRFNAQPFFTARSHAPVWQMLRTSIARGEGVILLTGEAGVGKSQLLLRLQGLLPETWDMALIPDGGQPQALFTESLCEAVGADIAGPQEWSVTAEEVLDAITNRVEFGRNLLVVIDDAHRLTQENLNILNSILLFAVSQARPVQILLVGRPELAHCLELPAFQLLRNAAIATESLPPLSRLEVLEYLRFQSRRLLGRTPRITWPAWFEVVAASQGNPQQINLLLHKIVFLNRGRDVSFLTGSLISKGRMALDPNYHPLPGRGFIPWVALALLLCLAGSVGGVLFLLGSSPVSFVKPLADQPLRVQSPPSPVQKELPAQAGEPIQEGHRMAPVQTKEMPASPVAPAVAIQESATPSQNGGETVQEPSVLPGQSLPPPVSKPLKRTTPAPGT